MNKRRKRRRARRQKQQRANGAGYQPEASPAGAKATPPTGGSATAAPPDLDIDQLEQQVEQQVALVVQHAQAITISSQETYEAAAAFLTDELKPALREIEDTFGPIVKAAHQAHREALAQRKRHEQPLLEAEKIVKRAIGSYHQEQRRIAAQAEAERLRAARQEAEQRALEEAAALERDGHQEAANERLEQPTTPVVNTPAPTAPKAAGTSVRTKTKYRIVDPGKIGPKFMKPDEAKIGKTVRAMGADAEAIVGGIEVYEEPVVAARSS